MPNVFLVGILGTVATVYLLLSPLLLLLLLPSRSLILCHSRASDDCPSPEERPPGEAWKGDGGLGRDGKGNREVERSQKKIQEGPQESGGTMQASTQPPVGATNTLRATGEHKRNMRRSFSIKV